MEKILAPTDCRLRPDIRGMEDGNMGALRAPGAAGTGPPPTFPRARRPVCRGPVGLARLSQASPPVDPRHHAPRLLSGERPPDRSQTWARCWSGATAARAVRGAGWGAARGGQPASRTHRPGSGQRQPRGATAGRQGDPAGLGGVASFAGGTAPAGDARWGPLRTGPPDGLGFPVAAPPRGPQQRGTRGLAVRPGPLPSSAPALDLASQEKERLEEKQRAARRERAREGAEWQTR